MHSQTKLSALAKKLAKLCMHNGVAAQNRVAEVLKSTEPLPRAERRQLLIFFHSALKRELSRYQANVEHAGPLEEAALAQIQVQLKAVYGHSFSVSQTQNEDLIAGLRITVADDVWEANVRYQLDQLALSLA
jgi:F-type H+-transporting ATPase subunit delta